jgi:pimeloyl-ACP methyl ester carboxylesterase
MDHYADDLATVTGHLDLHDAIHVGHGMPTTQAETINPDLLEFIRS